MPLDNIKSLGTKHLILYFCVPAQRENLSANEKTLKFAKQLQVCNYYKRYFLQVPVGGSVVP